MNPIYLLFDMTQTVIRNVVSHWSPDLYIFLNCLVVLVIFMNYKSKNVSLLLVAFNTKFKLACMPIKLTLKYKTLRLCFVKLARVLST